MNPLKIKAWQYDLVCNGVELSSGAIQDHLPEVMYKAFEIAGYKNSVVDEKFPAMINAFRFGAPPHGGIAPGIGRIVMLIADEPNIREVILFPMNGKAEDLMAAPSEVEDGALADLHIRRTPVIKPRRRLTSLVTKLFHQRVRVSPCESHMTLPSKITAPA